MTKLEINVGYTTRQNTVAVALSESNAKLTEQGTFVVEVTKCTGSEQEVKAMFEELCPYGSITKH